MADTDFKKLLAKVSLDTSDLQGNVKKLKGILDDLYQQEKKKSTEQKRAIDDHVASVKKNAQLQKEGSDQQLTASKKQIESLQKAKQAYGDITQAAVKLKAQTDLETISAGTVLKKRQDIVTQCEIEMERLSRLREPLLEESRLLSVITAERQKQLALVEKQQLEAARRVPLYGPTRQQLGVTAPQALQTEAQEASLALRLKMNQAQVLSESQVLAERQKIVALADKEIAALTKRGVLNQEERTQLATALTIREQQTRAIQTQLEGTQRLTEAEARALALEEKRKLAAAARVARQVVPADTQQVARLHVQLAQLDLNQTKEAKAIHEQILAILDRQIAAITSKVELDRADVAQVERLAAARRSEAAAAEGGKRHGEEGFLQGFIGKFQRGVVGGLGFRELAGGVFTGVITAEILGHAIGEVTHSMVELISNSGKLEHLTETFQRLGAVKGTDTQKFLEDLRGATHDMVGDIELLRLANAAWQSDMRVTNSQIIQLTHDTVALARAQGHTTDEAMSALQRAFIGRGRAVGAGAFAQLGRITGIQPAELMLQKFGAVLPQIIQRQEAFNHMLDVMHEKMLRVGEPTITITDRLKILSVEWERTREAFAISLVKTEGFRDFLGLIDQMIVGLRKGEEAGTAWGEKVGKAFGVVGPTLQVTWQIMKDMLGTFEALGAVVGTTASFFNDLTGALTGVNTSAKETQGMFSSFGNIFISFIEGTSVVVSGVELLAQSLELVIYELYKFFQLGTGQITTWQGLKDWFKEVAGGVTDFRKKLTEGNAALLDSVGKMEDARARLNAPVKPTPGVKQPGVEPEPPLPEDPAYLIKMAKLQLQLKEALDKEELENTKAKLQAEKDANEEAYNSLKETFEQYIAEKKRLRQEELEATLAEAKADRKAKIDEINLEEQLAGIEINKQMKAGGGHKVGETPEEEMASRERQRDLQNELALTNQQYEIRKKIVEAKYGGTVARATAAAGRDQQQYEDQRLKMIEAAARVHAQAVLKINQDALEEQKLTLEDNFKEGLVSADDYIAKRKAQIQQELQYTLNELDDRFNHTAVTLENIAKKEEEVAAARAKTDKELVKLQLDDDGIRIKSMEQSYDRVSKLLETQAKLAATPRGRALLGESEETAIEREIVLNDRKIKQAEIIAASLNKQSKEYADILEYISQAEEKQQRYNEELARARDLLTPVGNFLDKLAGALGGFHGTGISQVVEGLKAGAGTFQAVGEFQTTLKSQYGPNANALKVIQGEGKAAFDSLKRQSDSASGNLHGFAGVLQSATAVVGNFARALSGRPMQGEAQPSLGGLGTLAPPPSPTAPSVPPVEVTESLPFEARAAGGPVAAGETYIVGEKGPERFVPDVSGQIIPTTALPHYQLGTYSVPQTGPALLHAGESVLPAGVLGQLSGVVNQLIAAFRTLQVSVMGTAHVMGGRPATEKPADSAAPRTTWETIKNAVHPPPIKPITTSADSPTSAMGMLNDAVKTLVTAFKDLGTSIAAFRSSLTGTPGTQQLPGQTSLLGLPLSPTSIGTGIGDLPFTQQGIANATAAFSGGEALQGGGGGGEAAGGGGGFGSGAFSFLQALGGTGDNEGVGAVKKFVNTLTSAIGAVGGFIHSTLGATSATSGAIGGGLSGLSMGTNIGGMFGPEGAIIGAAVGTVAGAITGLISGQKNAEALKLINALSQQFNQIVQKLNDGILGLNQAIQQGEATAAKIASSGTGKKGAGKQAKQQALDQAEQTLQQLQEKQHQVLLQLQEQLDNLRVPTGYQEWLGTVEQILTQYKSFAEAAQNTQQLAQAQEYLTRALQQYATTQATQVQSAEISAIQNGINLNNLYLQRQQLMEQFGQQEQSIMSGGVQVREASASATKAGQLRDLQTQFAQQMDQLNMQISVSQYQYETQQKIFGLATTRVGLETQLLTLQDAQTDQQNASNAALLNIINLIRSTPASQLATTPQLLAALGLPYSGPTAGQVGPQIGPLGNVGTPAQFLQILQSSSEGKKFEKEALGTTSLSTLTPAQEQQVIQFIETWSTKNVPGQSVIDLYGQLQSILTGAPASQFNPLFPVPPLYPAQGGSPNVPWVYGSGFAGTGQPGTGQSTNPITGLPAGPNTQFPVPPMYPAAAAGGFQPTLQTPQSAGPSSPIYYLADTSGQVLTPVYNTPTMLNPNVRIVGGGGGGGTGGGAGTGTGTGAGGPGIIPVGVPIFRPQPEPGGGGPPAGPISFPTPPNPGGVLQPGENLIPFLFSGNQTDIEQAANYGFVQGATLPQGNTYPTPVGSQGTIAQRAGAPTALPAGMTLYGTDGNGAPIYVDPNGTLYNASGQQVGSVASGTFTVTGQTPVGFYTPPSFTTPTNVIPGAGSTTGLGSESGATTTLQDLLQYPQLGEQASTTLPGEGGSFAGLSSGNYVLPTGQGPSSGPQGPVFLAGSSNPFSGVFLENLLGSVAPTPPSPVGPPPGAPPPPPVIPPPTQPPPIDVSGIIAALDAAVANDVQAEKVTMGQFEAILNQVDTVGLPGTITALQAFHDQFAAHHSGPQSRASQNAMQQAINQLQQMENSTPALIAPIQPTAPSGGTAPSPYAATNTGVITDFHVPQPGGTPASGPVVPTSPVVTPPPVVGGAPTGGAPAAAGSPAVSPQFQALAQAELPKVMAIVQQFNAVLAQHASGAITDADALKQLTALRDALSVELEMIPSLGYLFSNVAGQMGTALAAVAKKSSVSTFSGTFTAPTTATLAGGGGFVATTFQLTPEQGQQVQQTLNSAMTDLNAIISSYNSGKSSAQETENALDAFHDKYSNQTLEAGVFGGQTYPLIAFGQQWQPIGDKAQELSNVVAPLAMASYHPSLDISSANPITVPTLQDILTQPVPTNMLGLSTNSLTFGPTAIGETSAPQTVGVSSGAAPAPVGTPTTAANVPTALELAAWAAGIPTRGGVPDAPVPGFTGTGATSTTAAPSLPANLVLYGTDASGNPTYVDSTTGTLYNLSGQVIGTVAATAPANPAIDSPWVDHAPPALPTSPVITPPPVTGGGGLPTSPNQTGLTFVGYTADGSKAYKDVSGNLYRVNAGIPYPIAAGTPLTSSPPTTPVGWTDVGMGVGMPMWWPLSGGPLTPVITPPPVTGGSVPFSPPPAKLPNMQLGPAPYGYMPAGAQSGGTWGEVNAQMTYTEPNGTVWTLSNNGWTAAAPAPPVITPPLVNTGVATAATNQARQAFSNISTTMPPSSTPGSTLSTAPPPPSPIISSVAASATNQATLTLNAAKVTTEQQVSSIASSRIGMETKLLQMKQQQNQNDLVVLTAYKQVMDAISSGNFNGISNALSALNRNQSGPGPVHIEDSLYKLYSERGRYGEGAFAGEYP